MPVAPRAEGAVLALMRHDALERERTYVASEHLCGICFCETPGREMRRCWPCGHGFCGECMGQHAAVHVKEAGQSPNLMTVFV